MLFSYTRSAIVERIYSDMTLLEAVYDILINLVVPDYSTHLASPPVGLQIKHFCFLVVLSIKLRVLYMQDKCSILFG